MKSVAKADPARQDNHLDTSAQQSRSANTSVSGAIADADSQKGHHQIRKLLGDLETAASQAADRETTRENRQKPTPASPPSSRIPTTKETDLRSNSQLRVPTTRTANDNVSVRLNNLQKDIEAYTINTPTGDCWLPHIATYRRELPVGLNSLYENILDWQRLPHLHKSHFAHIKCLQAGDWGWYVQTAMAKRPHDVLELELRLDRTARRWIVKVVSGPGSGTEVWTAALPIADRHTDIIVDFFVPDIPKENIEKTANDFVEICAQMFDKDVDMMRKRETALSRKLSKENKTQNSKKLGRLDQVRGNLPLIFELGSDKYRVIDLNGKLIAHVINCPHMLGPLQTAPVLDGIVQCPWHGYRFDLRTGSCLNANSLALKKAPKLYIDKSTKMVHAIMPEAEPAPQSGIRRVR